MLGRKSKSKRHTNGVFGWLHNQSTCPHLNVVLQAPHQSRPLVIVLHFWICTSLKQQPVWHKWPINYTKCCCTLIKPSCEARYALHLDTKTATAAQVQHSSA